MNLHRYKKVSDYKVQDWLIKSLNLTSDQKRILYDNELIRLSPFEFYEQRKKEKVSFLWRLTLPIYFIYYILLFICLPIGFIITGKWGYGMKFYDNFHAVWMKKLGL